ncbi:MAG: aromatic ring-hydroxylating dioxygenase subunit alpha [Pseudomonadales bacterium]
MKVIATNVDDNTSRMREMALAQKDKPGYPVGRYFYRSHVTFEQELGEIVFKSWLYAGHISQVKDVGDYFLYDVGEDSIIISRAGDGQVHASMNVCRHRGSRVCEETSGNRKTFVCPYHGWVFNIDGSLKAARHMELRDDFCPEDHGLKHPRIEVFEGLIFINCDPDAADFRPGLEKLAIPLGAYELESAKIIESRTYTVDANWKFVLENYLECYHCATSHRSYARMHTIKDLECNIETLTKEMLARAEQQTGIEGIGEEFSETYNDENDFGCGTYTSRYALYDGVKSGAEDGQAVAPLMGKFKGFDGGVGDFQLGPLCFMLNYPDYCVLYRFTPRGLTSTDMEVVWFVRDDAVEGVDYDKEKVIWLWHNTTLEDEFIITRNSEGANSRFFEPGPYNPEFEAPCIGFVNWYLDALLKNTD